MYLTQRNFLNTTKPTCAGAHLRFIICYAGIGTSIKTRADMIQTEKNCQQFNIKNTSFPIRKLFSGIEYCYYNSIDANCGLCGCVTFMHPLGTFKIKIFSFAWNTLWKLVHIRADIAPQSSVINIRSLFFMLFWDCGFHFSQKSYRSEFIATNSTIGIAFHVAHRTWYSRVSQLAISYNLRPSNISTCRE